MKLIEVGQIWITDAISRYAWIVIKLDGGCVLSSRIDLVNNTSLRSVLTYYSIINGLNYSSELDGWKLITDGPIVDKIKRLEWADKYL